MKPLTVEWIEKAEGDRDTALRELRARKRPNYDAACFHAQQLAEKYIKAFLQENAFAIPYSHNLIDLMMLCGQADSSFLLLQNDLISLEGYAIRFRYPGQSADQMEAKTAIRIAENVRQFVLSRLTQGLVLPPSASQAGG